MHVSFVPEPICAISLWLCLFSSPTLAQFNYTWEGTSGVTPDVSQPPHSLILSGDAPSPVLESGVLTISTDENAQNAFYLQTEPLVHTAGEFTMEFRVRLVSGSTSSNARAPITTFFTVTDSTGILLLIDIDKVFFVQGPVTPGAVAEVDTDDTPHTYRVEHDGAGGFTLFYDEQELLTAAAYTDAASHGRQMRIGWGEGSSFAFGVSEWHFVRHTAIDPVFRDSFEATD